jgi:hypothetical protein
MNCRSFIRLAALAVVAALSAPALAQDPTAAMGGNCMMTQLAKICSAKPGSPEFSVCAKQHSADAMASCQSAATVAREETRTTAKTPCAGDVQKYCPGKWPGSPEFISCMRENKSKFTPACLAFVKSKEGQHPKAGDDVCVADAKKYCPGLTVMDGAKFTSCMTKNYDSLGPTCQAKFKSFKGASSGPHAECMDAMQKLCPDLKPGDSGAMMQCMMAHQAELPASCHKH